MEGVRTHILNRVGHAGWNMHEITRAYLPRLGSYVHPPGCVLVADEVGDRRCRNTGCDDDGQIGYRDEAEPTVVAALRIRV